MSEIHSENNDYELGLTVRIKLVDLNHIGKSSPSSDRPAAAEQVSKECLSAIVGRRAEQASHSNSANPRNSHAHDYPSAEICMLTSERMSVRKFETHIETCSICANRVELQLDFMETLEVAVFQSNANPESQKVRGAMLISAPELNFAVCGELEVG